MGPRPAGPRMPAQDDAPTAPRPLRDQTCVVTGATSGIGEALAGELARRGATTVLVGRNLAKCRASVEAVRAASGNPNVDYVVADLSTLGGMRSLATTLLRERPDLDLLVHNAGAIFAERQRTIDGLERTFALNVLAPYLVTRLLWDRLVDSAPSRVVTIASEAHRHAHLDLDDLELEHDYAPYRAYSRSKLALLLLTREFAERFRGTGVSANAVHPGFVRTGFGRNNRGVFGAGVRVAATLFATSVARGVRTPLYAATSPAVSDLTGGYLVRERVAAPSARALDPTTARGLWARLEARFPTPAPSDGADAPGATEGAP